MKNFDFQRVSTQSAATALVAERPNAKFIGGGTSLVDLMRENIEQPATVIDVQSLPRNISEEIDGVVQIDAAVKNSALATDLQIREKFPVLSQALLNGASGQIRNMATVGGNILQRTRCDYFYDDAAKCNKRKPGSGCDALEGYNRMHAILGASKDCIATHPSDMCVALAALDATLVLSGTSGDRRLAFNNFHRLPGNTPQIETELLPGELISAVIIEVQRWYRNSVYRKVRDRSSYAFALVSVAAAMQIEGGVIREVRVALGGVAHKPWRAYKAEEILKGKQASRELFDAAIMQELSPAKGCGDNDFKIELARRTVIDVLEELSGSNA